MESEGLEGATVDDATMTAQAATNDNDNGNDDPWSALEVGCHVEVEDRTWPGMNKQGGIAKVKAIDRGKRTVDVQYVVETRKEKAISWDYIVLTPQYDKDALEGQHQQTHLRDRSRLKGRCTRCGSLRTDCGSCDWVDQVLIVRNNNRPTRSRLRKYDRKKDKAPFAQKARNDGILEESASSDDEEMKERKRKRKDWSTDLAQRKKEDQAEEEQRQKEEEQILRDLEREKARKEREKARQKSVSRSSSGSIGNEAGVSEAPGPAELDQESEKEDSSSSDDDYVPLMTQICRYGKEKKKKQAQSKRHNRGYQKTGSEPDNRQKRARQRRQQGSSSVLESVGAISTRETSRDKENRTPPNVHDVETNQGFPLDNDNMDDETTDGGADSNSSSYVTLDFAEDGSSSSEDRESLDAESEDSYSEDDFTPMGANARDHDSDSQASSDLNDDFEQDTEQAPDGSKRLKNFVANEGRKAAEQLPEDIKDRTAEIAYTDLPSFFDREADRIRDQLLPDAMLRFTRLEEKFNEWKNNPDGGSTAKMMAACDCLQKDFTKNAIQDGTDQCNATLRKLENQGRFNRESKKLSDSQRKAMQKERAPNKSVARDCRMEDLNQKVQSFMRKVRTLKESIAEVADDLSQACPDPYRTEWGDNDNDNASEDGNVSHLEEMQQSASSELDLARNLRPWSRHSYATNKRRGDPLLPSRKRQRSQSTRTTTKKGRKRSSLGTSVKSTRTNKTREPLQAMDEDPSNRASTAGAARKDRHTNATRKMRDHTHRPRRGRSGDRPQRNRKRGIDYEFRGQTKFEESMLIFWNDNLDEYNDVNLATTTAEEQPRAVVRRRIQQLRERRKAPPSTQRTRNNTNQRNARTQQAMANPANAPIADAIAREQRDGRNDARQRSASRTQRGRLIDPQLNRENGTNFQNHYSSVDQREVFSHLIHDERMASASDPLVGDGSDVQNVSDICESIGRLRPSEDPTAFVRKLKTMTAAITQQLTIDEESASKHAAALNGFKTLLQQLQEHCKATLIESLTLPGAFHVCSIAVLTETVALIQKELHLHLSSGDGLAFKMFSEDRSKGFLSAVVLQFVDVLYFVFHPTAWANPFQPGGATADGSNSRVAMLNALIPLRDSLSRVLDLPLNVCHCITSEMETQKWRLAISGEKHAFVSSVDPKVWTRLLQTGHCIEKTKAPRWSQFKDHLPRCEVEAVWSILAFVAGTNSLSKVSSDLPVRFASKLLLRGVLNTKIKPSSEGSSKAAFALALAPSPLQLEACLAETKHLSFLLLSGAFILPKNDAKFMDILMRALSLHSDAYIANNGPVRNGFLPTSSGNETKKTALQTVKTVWHSFLPSSALSEDVLVGDFLKQKGLAPSASFVRQSMSLLFLWTRLVPIQTARVNRFSAATRTLVGDLVKKAEEAEEGAVAADSNAGGEPDAFAVAFSASAGMVWQGVYLREAAAYLHLFAAMSMKHTLNSSTSGCRHDTKCILRITDAAKEVWNKMSDEAMQRRQKILSRGAESSTPEITYQGEDYRLYATGKAVAFATLATLGVQAWWGDNSEIPRVHIAGDLLSQEAPGKDYLLHLMTCLVACLDCCSDKKTTSMRPVMSSIATCVAICLSHANHQLTAMEGTGADGKFEALITLGDMSLQMLAPTLMRCFSFVTKDSSSETDSLISFRSLLSALYGAAVLTGHAQRIRARDSAEAPNEEDVAESDPDAHLWGDLKDEDLFGIDVVGPDAGGTTEDKNGADALFQFLSEALAESKPSRRFAVANEQRKSKLNLPSQARQLFGSHSHYVCDCLAMIASTDDASSRSLSSFLLQLQGAPNDDDRPYHDRLAQEISVSLCNLSHAIPRAADEVFTKKDVVVPILIDALLDSVAIGKFPTINSSRLNEMRSEQADSELERLRKAVLYGEQACRLDTKVWKTWRSFASTLLHKRGACNDDVDVSLGRRLTEVLSFEDAAFTRLTLVSMEQECLKRIVVLSTVLQQSKSMFEHLCFRIVAKSSLQVLELSKRLELAQRAQGDESPSGILMEQYLAYVEIHVAILFRIILQHQEANTTTPAMKSLLDCICNDYFPSLLQNNEQAAHKGLHDMISKSSCGARCAQQLNESQISTMTKARSGPLPYLEVLMLRESLLRRAAGLCLIEVGGNSTETRILPALFAAGTAKVDGSLSASPQETIARSLSLLRTANRSPLHLAVDEFMERQFPAQEGMRQRVCLSKHKLVMDQLLPRLRIKQSSPEAKSRIILFVEEILKADRKGTLPLLGMNRDQSLACLREIARGLTISLRASFESPAVEEELMIAAVSCCRVFARSLVSFNEEGSNTVVEWSRLLGSTMTTASADAGDEVITASYVHHSLLWFIRIAELVSASENNQMDGLVEFRKSLVADKDAWPLLSTDQEPTLKQLTTRLFASKEKVSRTIVNVYAKRRSNDNAGEGASMEAWYPTEAVRRGAKEFLQALASP